MFQDLRNRDSPLDVTVEHQANEVKVLFRHDVRYSQVVVHNLVDTVEWILLVDNRVEKDAEGPHILLFAAVRLAGEHFGCSVI